MRLGDYKRICPAGKWTCADGGEVLFNLNHAPILERRPGVPAKAADPSKPVFFVRSCFFFDARNSPWSRSDPYGASATIARINRVLAEWGQAPLPALSRGESEPWNDTQERRTKLILTGGRQPKARKPRAVKAEPPPVLTKVRLAIKY